MKVHTPEISWHNREAVLTIDVQCHEKQSEHGFLQYRIASGSMDNHVIIWRAAVKAVPNGPSGNFGITAVADLNRHTKPVNVVRFSPSGNLLASGDNEGNIIVWKRLSDAAADEESKRKSNGIDEALDDYGIVSEEQWIQSKLLRGHIRDVNDLCWSPNSNLVLSGSIDNSACIWNAVKGQRLHQFDSSKGYVQGVAWDPLDQYIFTISSDRFLRIINASSKRLLHKVYKTALKTPEQTSRLFYDDTFRSFCRRMSFSSGGEFLVVSSGIIEQPKENDEEVKFINCVHLFLRNSLNKPAACYPTGLKYNVAVSCCPTPFCLRKNRKNSFPFEYRIVFAIATNDAVFFYDTQHDSPFALVSDVHYASLSDLNWSADGRLLMVSSTDGYCTFIAFDENELGHRYEGELYKFEQPSAVVDSPQNKASNHANAKNERAPEIVKKTPESAKITKFFTKVPKRELSEGVQALTGKRKAPGDPLDEVMILEEAELSSKPANVETEMAVVGNASGPSDRPDTAPHIAGVPQSPTRPAVVSKKPRRVEFITLTTPK